jgi:acyl carrier protein
MVFLAVRQQLAALLLPGSTLEINEESLLIEELGLDSMKFVDLTVNLEDALHISELPMQAWIDEELESGRSLSVGGLVQACRAALRAGAR